jgi:hypothetical protein
VLVSAFLLVTVVLSPLKPFPVRPFPSERQANAATCGCAGHSSAYRASLSGEGVRGSHGEAPSHVLVQLFVFPAAGAVVLAIVGKGYRLALAATVGLMVKETQLTGALCGWYCAAPGLMSRRQAFPSRSMR